MSATADAVDATARDDEVRRVDEVRRFVRGREHAPSVRDTVGRVAYQLYVVALLLGIYGTAVGRALADPSDAVTVLPPAAPDVVPTALVVLAALASVAGIRLGTWAGPVLLSRPDAAWLLPAPLDRRRLLRRNLGLGLAGFGLVGGLVGALVGLVAALETGAGVLAPLGGTALGWAALGVLAGCGALAVEASQRRARWALRGTLVLLVGVGLLGWLSSTAPALGAWLTPWGWATATVTAAVGVDVPLAWLPPLLLVVAAVPAVVASLRSLGGLPDEELVRRAGTAQGVRASATVFDARAIAQARRSGQRWVLGVRTVRIRRPRARWLLMPWRDLVSLLRRPGLAERTVAVVVGTAAVVAWARGGWAALVVGVLAVSGLAGQLLEPMRVELEEPVLADLTPLRPEEVVLEHVAVPAVLLVALAVVAGGATTLLVGASGEAVLAAVLGCAALAVLLTCAAALTSTRGAPPLHLLTNGDYGVVMLLGWMLAGPLLALVLGLPAALLVAVELRAGTAPMAAIGRPAVLCLVLAVALLLATRWRARKRLAPDDD